MTTTRRDFIRKSSMAGMASYMGALGLSASSYRRIIGANDRVRVGVVGFSDRHRNDHIPAFMKSNQELNVDIIAVADIWKKRREEGKDFLAARFGHPVQACVNNDDVYACKEVDDVM